MLLDLFLSAFITLFVIMDPLGNATVFTALTAGQSGSKIKSIAVTATLVAFFLLLFFAFLGMPLLTKLGITLPAFHIAGGLMLFVTAFRMLFGQNESDAVEKDKGSYKNRPDIAIFPLAIPLTAGPGCITAIILLMTKAAEVTGGTAVVLSALIAVHAVALLCFLAAIPIQKLIGINGTNILARVMGMILAAMSVQFIVDGLRSIDFHALS